VHKLQIANLQCTLLNVQHLTILCLWKGGFTGGVFSRKNLLHTGTSHQITEELINNVSSKQIGKGSDNDKNIKIKKPPKSKIAILHDKTFINHFKKEPGKNVIFFFSDVK